MNGIKVILLLNGLISFICLFFRNNKMDDNVAILLSLVMFDKGYV